MEAIENDAKKCFENLLESFIRLGETAASRYEKQLNMERLTDSKKARLIDVHIHLVTAKLHEIGRMEYCSHETGQLWELIKSKGGLDNAEEIQKLKDMILQGAIFRRLVMLQLNVDFKIKSAKKKSKNYKSLGREELLAQDLYEVLSDMDKDYHLVAAPSTLDDLVMAALSHDWSTEKEPIYIRCKTTDLKAIVDCIKRHNPDFNYANIGNCKLFISKQGNFISAHDLASSTSTDHEKTLRVESYFVRLRKKY